MALIDSYTTINSTKSMAIKRVHPSTELNAFSSVGQSLKYFDSSYILTQVKFKLRRANNPTGILRAKIYSASRVNSALKPTGLYRTTVDLPLAISDPVEISAIPSPYTYITFDFPEDQQFRMKRNKGGNNQVCYFAVCQAMSGVINDSNYILLQADLAGTAEGNMAYFTFKTWLYSATIDCLYYAYGDPYTEESADIIVGRPDMDISCVWGGAWLESQVIDNIPAGLTANELRGKEATADEYRWQLEQGAFYFTADGHGNATTFTGQGQEIIFTTAQDLTPYVSGKHFNFLSCSVGLELAPYIANEGAIGVHAYTNVWTFWYESDNYPNDEAKYFYLPHFEVDAQLLAGNTHRAAHLACIAKYQEYIDDDDVPEYIKADLLDDMNGKVFFGDSNASVIAEASSLVFDTQPSNSSIGSAISPSVTVKVYDNYGAFYSSDNSTSITITIDENPSNGILVGTLTATASDGIATFDDLKIDRVGEGYTLLASASSLTSDISDSFNVTREVGLSSGRVAVKRKQGAVIPCNGCKKEYYCALYKHVKKVRGRKGSNILTYCDMWEATQRR